MIGFYTPFVYLPNMAIVTGVSVPDASFLVSVIGISNTLGRVLAGWGSDFSWVNSLVMTNTAISLSILLVLLELRCLRSCFWVLCCCVHLLDIYCAGGFAGTGQPHICVWSSHPLQRILQHDWSP